MRFFIASDNDAVTRQLHDLLREGGHDAVASGLSPPDMAVNRLAQSQPGAVLLVLSPRPDPAFAFLAEAHKSGSPRILAVGPLDDPKVRLNALAHGADQYLDQSQLPLELQVILRRFSNAQQPAPMPTESGKVISVLAPSGGSGSSTLAANLATILAKEHKNCLLIDLNLGAADLAALLDLKPTHTLADLCRNSTRMDRAIFERCLTKHASGVNLLSSARSFADISQVSVQGARDALTMGRALFPYVIVDLDDSFHSEQTQMLRQSEIILLVLRLDFTSLRNTQRTLDHLTQLQISRDRVRLVVNRYGQPQELPVSKAEEALSMKITYYVPDDPKTINRANNHGIPAVLEAPTAKVSKAVFQLAQSVNGQAKH